MKRPLALWRRAIAVSALLAAAGVALAHGPESSDKPTPDVDVRTKDGLAVHFEADPDRATVGRAVRFRVRVTDDTGNLIREVEIDETILATEEGEEPIFHAVSVSPDGTWEHQFEFCDGAEHKVVLSVRPAKGCPKTFEAVPVEAWIGVTAIEPPTDVVVKTISYLLASLAAGTCLGYAARRRLTGVKA